MRVYGGSSVRGSRCRGVFSFLLAAFLLSLIAPAGARAGFASDEVFLPAVGRITGAGGAAQFYTTVWATNLSGVPVTFTFQFLRQGQANTSPTSFTDSLAAGQTKVYENVVETKLSLTSAIGAARITATGPVLVSERIYNQPPAPTSATPKGSSSPRSRSHSPFTRENRRRSRASTRETARTSGTTSPSSKPAAPRRRSTSRSSTAPAFFSVSRPSCCPLTSSSSPTWATSSPRSRRPTHESPRP